jgi:hypothetical protein
MWHSLGVTLFAFAIVSEQAHVASPIILAWAKPGLRQIALSRPIETVLLPVVAVVFALTLPFLTVFWIYGIWNIYHFGSQNYGAAKIFGWPVNRWLAIGVTAAVMTPALLAKAGVPTVHLPYWFGWAALFAIDFNHWLVDLGLSARVFKRYGLFALMTLPFGLMGFLWKVPRADHIATLAIPLVIQARWGIGMAHFLYSRWIWKLSDPRMRAIIGEDILLPRHSRFRV